MGLSVLLIRRAILLLGVAIVLLQGILPAWAQVNVPPAGKPGVIEKSLQQSRPEFQPPKEDLPEITIKDSRKVLDPGAGPSFWVRQVTLEGNTLFPDSELEPLVRMEEPTQLTLGILSLMADDVSSYYASRGYVLSFAFVPAQEVVDGVVRVQVVEAGIDRIQVEGNRGFETEDILKRMKPVLDEPVLKEQTLEKTLLELNEVDGLEVRSVLKPGAKTGTSDLLLEVKESRPYSIAFDADNFGSRFTGVQRFGLTASLGNLGVLGDRLSIRAVKSNKDQNFINPRYTIPIGPYGTTLGISYIFSDFTLSELGGLVAGGESHIFSMDITQSLIRTRQAELYIALGGDIRNFENDQAGTPTSDDKLRNVHLTLGGFLNDSFRGRTFYTLRLQKGLTEDDIGDPLNSRFQGRGDAFITTLNIRRYQSAYFWNSYFILNGQGQVVTDRVLSPDLFAIGGVGSVRGFPLAENAGDQGFAVSLEYVLPFPWKVELTEQKGIQSLDQVLSLFGFIDHGQIFVRNQQPGERRNELTGAGAGIRVHVPSWGTRYPDISFTLAWGFPVLGNNKPSDGSSSTLLLGGLVSF